MPVPTDRHHRQSLLPQIGRDGTARLRAAHVTILGVGALGSTVAEHLVRAGVGALTLVDRDIVDVTNLQRQTLYTEGDLGMPKAEAAAWRLAAIDGAAAIDARATDIDASNIDTLLPTSLIVDGSDNAELRYLINDFCVGRSLPWVMGGVIGVEGRVAGFKVPWPCLRCLFATPPAAGELATCDTAGVLGPAVGVVASLQAVEAIKLLVGDPTAAHALHVVDVWRPRFATIDLRDARRADCPCCARGDLEFLRRAPSGGARLCGRNAVQVRPPAPTRIDLAALAARLAPIAAVETTQLMVKCVLPDRPELKLSVFGDGRMLAVGTEDVALARGIYARVVGA